MRRGRVKGNRKRERQGEEGDKGRELRQRTTESEEVRKWQS